MLVDEELHPVLLEDDGETVEALQPPTELRAGDQRDAHLARFLEALEEETVLDVDRMLCHVETILFPGIPGALVLQKIENTARGRIGVVGCEPDDVGLAAEPGDLALGVSTSRPDRLVDRLVEADLSADVLGELPVTDRLERRQTRVPTSLQEPFDFPNPPHRDHRGDALRDAMVQDASREGQSDAERGKGIVREG
jgi:hypothetical protein